MALIKCPECGKEISDKAPACIHCGYPLNPAPAPASEPAPKPAAPKSKKAGTLQKVMLPTMNGAFPYRTNCMFEIVNSLGMTLADAKSLLEQSGDYVIVAENLAQEDAEHIVGRFRSLGAVEAFSCGMDEADYPPRKDGGVPPPIPENVKMENSGCFLGLSLAASCIIALIVAVIAGTDSPVFIPAMVVAAAVFLASVIVTWMSAARSSEPDPEVSKVTGDWEKLKKRREAEGYEYGPLIDYAQVEKAEIISQDSKKSLGSAAVRGAVGAVVAGPVGLAAGAVTAKSKGSTIFRVTMRSGTINVVTVKNGGDAFQKLFNRVGIE